MEVFAREIDDLQCTVVMGEVDGKRLEMAEVKNSRRTPRFRCEISWRMGLFRMQMFAPFPGSYSFEGFDDLLDEIANIRRTALHAPS